MEYMDIHFWEEKRGCFQGPLVFYNENSTCLCGNWSLPYFQSPSLWWREFGPLLQIWASMLCIPCCDQ